MQINRINAYSSQKQNNKPAFGMAIRNINKYGMTELEKKALTECLPELKILYKDLDCDVELLTDLQKGRQFRVLTSAIQNTTQRLGEFVPGGKHWHYNDKAGLRNLKDELLRNAIDSIDKYKAHNAKNSISATIDVNLKQAFEKTQKSTNIEEVSKIINKTEFYEGITTNSPRVENLKTM